MQGEWVKRNTLRWFGHIERMNSEEFVKKMNGSETECSTSPRGRPLGRRKDKVEEYMSERGGTRGGGLEQIRRECLNRERCRLFCHCLR